MIITFLIGNGFDVGLGLKTRYEDFYEHYRIINVDDTETIKSFKKNFCNDEKKDKDKIIDWSDFEKAFGEYSNEFAMDEKEKYIECFEDFVSNFNSYLEDEESNIDYSNKNKIAEMMKNAVTTYFKIRKEDGIAINSLYSEFSNQRVYNFISFNYTRTIDTCAQILSEYLKGDNYREVGHVEHIHGFIEDSMIMGVNDSTQILNSDFSNDSDVVHEIVKPQQNIDSKTNNENTIIPIIEKSNIICIYGMSIGYTDKKWWDIITKWLSQNDKRKLVILTHDRNYNKRFPYSQRKVTNNLIDRFLSFSTLGDDKKATIKEQIYIGVNYDVFSLNLRNGSLKENIKKEYAKA